jgi:hypothetical protein
MDHGTGRFVMNRGKIVILLIFGTALVISIGSVWFRHQQMRHVIDTFTSPVAQLIAYAPEAEILQLGAPSDELVGEDRPVGAEEIKIAHRIYPIVARKKVDSSRGFGKLRADLVRDSNYAWPEPTDMVVEKTLAEWQYVLLLTDDKEQARLAFSPDTCQMMLIDAVRIVSIAPICEATKELLAEQFAKGR